MRVLAFFILSVMTYMCLSQSFCTADVNYTFTGYCAQIAAFNNRTKVFSNLQGVQAGITDFSANQLFAWALGNRTTVVFKTPACVAAFYDNICSSLQPCYKGRTALPCYSVCLNYYYQCTFDSEIQTHLRCDILAQTGMYAASNETFCERVSGSRPLTFSLIVLVMSILMIL
jgi:hypothetical protein